MSGTFDENRREQEKSKVAQENEQLKLMANLLNGVSVSLIALGTVTPLLAWLYQLTTAPNLDGRRMACVIVLSVLLSIGCHATGQLALAEIK
jgi:hypothetical protein